MLELINAYIEEHYANASESHKEAFRNSVTYLVGGYSAGSGPSLREHLVSWSLAGLEGIVETTEVNINQVPVRLSLIYPDGVLPRAGEWELNKALKHASPYCFGPAEDYIKVLEKIAKAEYCFDNDVQDLKALRDRGYII